MEELRDEHVVTEGGNVSFYYWNTTGSAGYSGGRWMFGYQRVVVENDYSFCVWSTLYNI